MPGSRLTFLYPHLFRSTGRWTEPALSQVSQATRRKPPPSSQLRPFTTPSTSLQAPSFAKRAGKGVEPPQSPSPQEQPAQPQPQDAPPSPQPQDAPPSPQPDPEKGSPTSKPPIGEKYKESQEQPILTSSSPSPETIELPPPSDPKKPSPMTEILHMQPPPTPEAPTATLTPTPPSPQSPSLNSPLPHHTYVHHFDSYSLVKHLSQGGYTLPQAIQTMKAIRAILASNLDDAQAKLHSKSDVENETYLFRAACSELSAEVRNNRRVSDEVLRQQRTHLQHEVDILTQRLNQELMTLMDSVRGMFNDRRMAVREEQKAVESRIQQIHYKISVRLNSDAKSDIEGLRWVLIRRSVFGIVFMLVFALFSLRYANFRSHQKQEEIKRAEKEKEKAKRNGGKLDLSAAPEAAEILAAN
ncbi:hypothetical protein QBC38DRAFT_464225 [Podospora fimiseda]|uniref:MOZ protein represents a chromatin-associated acetyltransferase n=1 Tax=Podospora fimiseda TaxID=252190 RepID=A0AAN7H886_9PEZI|nr:hypothetical protein QBC38DRAFT_464225 [Podospora fimiseda]